MNEQQKITALFNDKSHVLSIVSKATRCLSISKGKAATYAETMEEFCLAFRAIATGTNSPEFQVRHPEIEVNIKADRKCTRYVFGSPHRLAKFTSIALEMWTRCILRPSDFDEAISYYVNNFDQVATTHTARELWGVDSWLNFARNKGSAMVASKFQKTMSAFAKYPQFDRHVLDFFGLVGTCNFFGANTMFVRIHKEYCNRITNISRDELRKYLLAMTIVLDDPEKHAVYINDLEQWAEKHKLKENLQVGLATGRRQELGKI